MHPCVLNGSILWFRLCWVEKLNKHPEPDIELTNAARQQLRLSVKEHGCSGVRIAVKEAGCSGLEYVMDYADSPAGNDYIKVCDGFSIYIDAESYRKALAGLRLDYQEDALSAGFIFANPNKKGECGCGMSFTV